MTRIPHPLYDDKQGRHMVCDRLLTLLIVNEPPAMSSIVSLLSRAYIRLANDILPVFNGNQVLFCLGPL